MNKPQLLLNRLNAIGRLLEGTGHALALIGLGSVGIETDRLDEYSDLDFFAIVEKGYKTRYIDDLRWLEEVAPVAYAFRNTPDGYKLLFEDGIFCEFAVFEPDELSHIPFERGRVVWKQPQVEETIGAPAVTAEPAAELNAEWLLGEALTNLYVGLCRLRRGEKLSAARFIQGYAVDRVLELVTLLEKESQASRDKFANERRFEQRYPGFAVELPLFIQGYERSNESAQAILAFLKGHFEVNAAIAGAIQRLGDPQSI
jgi:hypothetical protein